MVNLYAPTGKPLDFLKKNNIYNQIKFMKNPDEWDDWYPDSNI